MPSGRLFQARTFILLVVLLTEFTLGYAVPPSDDTTISEEDKQTKTSVLRSLYQQLTRLKKLIMEDPDPTRRQRPAAVKRGIVTNCIAKCVRRQTLSFLGCKSMCH